jgi:hypothetical protein
MWKSFWDVPLFVCVYSLCPFPLAARAAERENSNKLLSGRTKPLFLPAHRSIWFPAQHLMANRRDTPWIQVNYFWSPTGHREKSDVLGFSARLRERHRYTDSPRAHVALHRHHKSWVASAMHKSRSRQIASLIWRAAATQLILHLANSWRRFAHCMNEHAISTRTMQAMQKLRTANGCCASALLWCNCVSITHQAARCSCRLTRWSVKCDLIN